MKPKKDPLTANDPIKVSPLSQSDRGWVRDVCIREWEADFVVVHNQIYRPHELDGFKAEVEGRQIGLVTYTISGEKCEVVTLNSELPGRGIGTVLMKAVEKNAIRQGCLCCWLVTTNNNTNAIRFYQAMGYEITEVHADAVAEARLLKPSIPLVDEQGIPIKDEVFLRKDLIHGEKWGIV